MRKKISGYEQLKNSIMEQLDFMGIDPNKITNVETNTGCTWFEVKDRKTLEGTKYYLHIDECADDNELEDE